MDHEVAYELINARINELRQQPYVELVKLVDSPIALEQLGSDGKTYNLEIQAVWDGDKGGDVRVLVSAEDGGLRAFMPLTEDFIKSADGNFVGE